ncbi:MAG: 50S ribosomal protein L11 methyltransferase [Candidatus Bathyarchaeota archaeon]|nr:50S ribosomal protein L11 methyltransferase [Candidatus Bathyarchaeota archaeon]
MKVLFDQTSPYQRVTLVEDSGTGRFCLLLNGHPQFVHPGEEIYHRELIDRAISMLGRRPRRVLVVGGGDGLPARNALRLGAQEVYTVDIDPLVVKLSMTHPLMRTLNMDSLRRSNVVISDAQNVPSMGLGNFDLISMDLTEPDRLSQKLYSRNFVKKLIQMLRQGGVLSAYENRSFMGFARSISKSGFVPGMGFFSIFYYKN